MKEGNERTVRLGEWKGIGKEDRERVRLDGREE